MTIIALPGPTLFHGAASLARTQLAEVIELPVVKGADIPGVHQGHYRDHDRSFADCLCYIKAAVLAGRPCPKHQAPQYVTFGAKHRGVAA